MKTNIIKGIAVAVLAGGFFACKPDNAGKNGGSEIAGDAAQKVYVAPGKHDEF